VAAKFAKSVANAFLGMNPVYFFVTVVTRVFTCFVAHRNSRLLPKESGSAAAVLNVNAAGKRFHYL